MARLEQLTRGATVKGILPDALITVVDVQWHGDVAVTLTYRDAACRLGNEILYRDSEPGIEIVTVGLPWSFDGDGALLRLVSEAYRIHLAFEIITNDRLEAARSGNAFAETNLAICRLDKLSRNEDAQAKLEQTDWDLIVVDEAHKMSASFFGDEVKYTKRYRLGQVLSRLTRHFLLLTATPHNGKEADFQLFLALLDGDRFEGRFRDGVHTADASDLMRRLV